MPVAYSHNHLTVQVETHLRDRTPAAPAVALQVAEKRWGKPGDSAWLGTSRLTFNPGLTPPDPDPKKKKRKPPSLSARVVQLNEVARATKTVRVSNPADEGQYVDVERIEDIVFNDGGGLALVMADAAKGLVTDVTFIYKLKN